MNSTFEKKKKKETSVFYARKSRIAKVMLHVCTLFMLMKCLGWQITMLVMMDKGNGLQGGWKVGKVHSVHSQNKYRCTDDRNKQLRAVGEWNTAVCNKTGLLATHTDSDVL